MDPILIPIVSIVSTSAFGLIVIGLGLYFGFQKRKLQNKEILSAIEKGIDVPFPKSKEKNYRAQGLVFTLTGLVLSIALWSTTGSIKGFVWGLIPVALGIAYLIIARDDKKEKE